jgi:hypothetical protein
MSFYFPHIKFILHRSESKDSRAMSFVFQSKIVTLSKQGRTRVNFRFDPTPGNAPHFWLGALKFQISLTPVCKRSGIEIGFKKFHLFVSGRPQTPNVSLRLAHQTLKLKFQIYGRKHPTFFACIVPPTMALLFDSVDHIPSMGGATAATAPGEEPVHAGHDAPGHSTPPPPDSRIGIDQESPSEQSYGTPSESDSSTLPSIIGPSSLNHLTRIETRARGSEPSDRRFPLTPQIINEPECQA